MTTSRLRRKKLTSEQLEASIAESYRLLEALERHGVKRGMFDARDERIELSYEDVRTLLGKPSPKEASSA